MTDATWEQKVEADAHVLGQVLFSNFKHAIDTCMRHAPDQLDKEQRAVVFSTVTQAWIGAAMIPIATFANTTKEIENMVIDEIRIKFQWIRDNEKELQLQRLDQMAHQRREKTGLIIAPGNPSEA